MKPGENPGRWRTLLLRLVVTGVVLGIWFWTQSLLGTRTPPASGGIGDALHNLTSGLNSYLAQNTAAANALLIVSSVFIDASASSYSAVGSSAAAFGRFWDWFC